MTTLDLADVVVVAGRTLGLEPAEVLGEVALAAWLCWQHPGTGRRAVVGSIGRLGQSRQREVQGAMFERFTNRARRVVVPAREEARLLNHNYIGTEHIRLGLIREREGVAAQVLVKLGADLPRVRQQVIQLLSLAPRPSGVEVDDEPDEDLETQTIDLIAGAFEENRVLRAEVRSLRELLRRHGIEPDGGASRTA